MEFNGYIWTMWDDPLCDIGDWGYTYENCTECPEFESCYYKDKKIDEENS